MKRVTKKDLALFLYHLEQYIISDVKFNFAMLDNKVTQSRQVLKQQASAHLEYIVANKHILDSVEYKRRSQTLEQNLFKMWSSQNLN